MLFSFMHTICIDVGYQSAIDYSSSLMQIKAVFLRHLHALFLQKQRNKVFPLHSETKCLLHSETKSVSCIQKQKLSPTFRNIICLLYSKQNLSPAFRNKICFLRSETKSVSYIQKHNVFYIQNKICLLHLIMHSRTKVCLLPSERNFVSCFQERKYVSCIQISLLHLFNKIIFMKLNTIVM